MSGMVGREVQVLMNIDSSTNSTKRRRRPKGSISVLQYKFTKGKKSSNIEEWLKNPLLVVFYFYDIKKTY